MQIVGIQYATNSKGERVTTLHVASDFPQHYNSPELGRTAVGRMVENIYVGTYDCSGLKVGEGIEVYFDKAITTKSGTFSPVKLIQVIGK